MHLLLLLLAADVEVQGSFAERVEVTFPNEEALFSTADQPILFSLTEANGQVRGRFLEEKLRLYLDASAFLPINGEWYADADPLSGELELVEDHDTGVRPFIALSEYYGSYEPMQNIVITAGKQRITWGSGFAWSPTDVFNPPRDPTDPSLQRAGFLQARLDVPFERFTFSALFAPQVLETYSGIPYRVLEDTDEDFHWAAAARAYALVMDTDVNVWAILSNRYNDEFEEHLRFAFSVSRNIFGEHEVHTDVLIEQGSARLYANPDCVDALFELALCQLAGKVPLEASLLDSDRVLPKILVGWRWLPADGSMLNVEYLYQADGFLRSEHEDFLRLVSLIGGLQRSGVPVPISSAQGGDEAPVRLNFHPQRRHTLFVSYTKPQIMDDFTINASLIVPLEDLSALATGAITWQAQEWLTLSLYGFVPLPSPAKISAESDDDPWGDFYDSVDNDWKGFVPRGSDVNGVPLGDFDIAPFTSRVMFEARAYF